MSINNNRLIMTALVEGTRPILFHKFGPDAIPLEKQERGGVAGNDPGEWRRSVIMDERRQLYVPGGYMFGSLRDGAKFTKGRGKGSMQNSMSSTLEIKEARIYLVSGEGEQPLIVPPDEEIDEGWHDAGLYDEPAKSVYRQISGVKNPANRARNVRYRIAAGAGWRMRFSATFDRTLISRELMEAILRDAGALVGIGDGRSIGFGRYAVLDVHFSGGNDSAD